MEDHFLLVLTMLAALLGTTIFAWFLWVEMSSRSSQVSRDRRSRPRSAAPR